jgi:hypothetical protein
MVEMTGIEPVGALIQIARPQTIATPETEEAVPFAGNGFIL